MQTVKLFHFTHSMLLSRESKFSFQIGHIHRRHLRSCPTASHADDHHHPDSARLSSYKSTFIHQTLKLNLRKIFNFQVNGVNVYAATTIGYLLYTLGQVFLFCIFGNRLIEEVKLKIVTV